MKFGQIPTCEYPLLWGVILFGAFLNVILLFSNAYGESINVNDLANFTVLENLSKTTKSHTLLENELDNIKTDQLKEKFVAQIKLIDDKKAVIKVIPISFKTSSLKEEFESPKSDLVSSDRNDTGKSENKTDVLPPPPTISYIENEGEQLNALNYVSKDSDIKTSQEEDDDESNRNTSQEEDDDESNRNTSQEEDDDESNRNTSQEEDDDESNRNTSQEEDDDESNRNTSQEEDDDESNRNTSQEEDDDESNRNTSQEEDDDESNRNTSQEEDDDESNRNTSQEEDDDESNRNTSQEEDDDESNRNTSQEEDDDESNRNTSQEEDDDESNRNTSQEEDDDESNRNTSQEEDDDESNRNTSQEEDDDESNRNTSQENTREVYLKKSNLLSMNQLSGNKTIGNSIDNENNKLISQFSGLNSSVRSNLQIPSVEANSKLEDRKPIANAGLDQVIMSDQNIVLDASASFDPEGKMSSYLWKPIENSEDNPNTSNSMIYSFPIPEDLEGNTLEFKLIVMDDNGQEDTDTVKFLINEKDEEESEP